MRSAASAQPASRATVLSIGLLALATGCEGPLTGLDHEITLSAAVGEDRKPVAPRDRFSFEDENIYVHLSIPPEHAGPTQRDFHFEIFDGDGYIVGASGAPVTRARAEWLVISQYGIDPETDAPGLWSLDVYVDRRHVERVRFPVTRKPSDPLPDTAATAAEDRPPACCLAPGAMTHQVFFGTGVDEETLKLTGRRERFRLSDQRMYVYLRLNNIPDGEHTLRFDFYDGDGNALWHYDQSFESRGRRRLSWVWREFEPEQDTPGLWTVALRFDGNLLGDVAVPVAP